MTDFDKFHVSASGRDGVSGGGPLEENVLSKILRETQMVAGGVGSAFLDTAKNPIEKLPEMAVATGFGVGLKMLQKAGATGRAIAGVVGLGMAGKMAYDEYMGDRWSTFGAALNDNWQSSANFERNLLATKESVGALAVDSTVSMIGFKVAGSHVGRRVLNGEIGSKVPLRLSGASSYMEAPVGATDSLSRLSAEMYQGISNRIKQSSGVEHPSILGARAQGGVSSTSFLKTLDPRAPVNPALVDVVHLAGQRLSYMEKPVLKPMEPGSGPGGASNNLEVPSETLASLNRLSSEMYEGIKANIDKNANTKLGTPSADAAVGNGTYRWIPPRETANAFSRNYPTSLEPLQGADAVVSLTSQGTVGSLALSNSLATPFAAARLHAIVGYAELAATDPAACDAALASTLLGRIGMAGRTTNIKAALKGAEAFVNGDKGNSFTAYLSNRYGEPFF